MKPRVVGFTAQTAILYAFDPVEHDGEDLRNRSLLDRKAALSRLLRDNCKELNVKVFTDARYATVLLRFSIHDRVIDYRCDPLFDQEHIMTILAAKTKRHTISSDTRAIVYVVAIIGAVTVVPFALLGQHFAPNVAKDLQHQSEMLSQVSDPVGAAAASRRAVDIYRGLMRVSAVQYAPELAASQHDLSIRLKEAGDDAGALAAIREAVEIRRRLAKFSSTDAARLAQSLQLLMRIESARAANFRA